MLTRSDTFLTGLIGSGIGTSLSPPLHEREAAELGMRYAYRTLDIDALGLGVGELLPRARDAGYDGLNVTHPCKRAVLEHLDALDDDAVAIGAVNTVVISDGHTTGYNTDVIGFAESVRRGLPRARLGTVVLFGAGGAGAALAHALRRLGTGDLVIVDSERGRATALARTVGGRVGEPADVAHADGLVHATPTGMEGHPGIALDPGLLHEDLWVADIVYRPLETQLLRAARARGCLTLDGGGMVVFQAAASLELFTGVCPDPERMLRHFAELTA
jgi:quinate/shikimate dehydrogenase (NAD+)